MAQLVITNVSSKPIRIQEMYLDLGPGEMHSMDRPQWDLSGLYSLFSLINAGKATISLSYSPEETAAKALGLLFGSGGGGGAGLVFADFGTQDTSQGRFTSWNDLMTALSQFQFGAAPVVRLALTGGPFAVPLAGMPANGWDTRGGTFTSFYGATGSVVLDCAPGVKFDNLFGIGGAALGQGAVIMKIAPPPGTNVLNFSALPPGAAYIFTIGGGSAIDHSTDSGSLMQGPDANTTMVLVSAGSQQNSGIVPPLSGPLLSLGATDGAVGVQLQFGGLPDGWLAGGGPGSTLLNIFDLNASANTRNVPAWVPAFTGGGGVVEFNFGKASLVNYTPAVLGDWSGTPPTSIADALDRIAAHVGPIP